MISDIHEASGEERFELETNEERSIFTNIRELFAGFVRGLNPVRFYHTVGKHTFIEFLVFVVFLLFFYVPLINLFMLAFANTYQFPAVIPQEFGFRWWEFVFGQDNLMSSIMTSFSLALIVTLVGLLICIPAAYAIARFEFKGRKAIMFSFMLSNAFPKIGLYTSIGIIFYRFNLMGTYPGVVIIHLINALMLLIWLPAGAFRSVRREQEEAAYDVGAGSFRTFVNITLPLASPGIIVAALYTFLGSLEEAEGTLLVGFPEVSTMPISMYGIILEYPATAGAVFALLLIVPSILIAFIFRKYLNPSTIGNSMTMN